MSVLMDYRLSRYNTDNTKTCTASQVFPSALEIHKFLETGRLICNQEVVVVVGFISSYIPFSVTHALSLTL